MASKMNLSANQKYERLKNGSFHGLKRQGERKSKKTFIMNIDGTKDQKDKRQLQRHSAMKKGDVEGPKGQKAATRTFDDEKR